MDSVLRRLRLRRRDSRENDARKSLQENLYEYSRFSGLGFPTKPNALAYDPVLDLLAIGTKSGALKLYGQPGVCLQGQHKDSVAVVHIIFMPHQCSLLTLCSDNSLHQWKLSSVKDQSSVLEEKKAFTIETNRLKTVSAWCLLSDERVLLLGTVEGNVHFFDVESFSLVDRVITQELIVRSSSEVAVEREDFKLGLGTVECICQQPLEKQKVLIGFTHGVIVLWNTNENSPTKIYNSMQTLESLSFIGRGEEFVSSHADGSFILWKTEDAILPKEPATAPYGPFPCSSITKIIWKTSNEEPFLVFSGGMPRASYGDRYTVTVMHGDCHVVFDFTSKIIDFFVLSTPSRLDESEANDGSSLSALFILAEEELVAIDLTSTGWPLFRLPYLVSLHGSVVTSIHHVSSVPEALWNKITDAGSVQFTQCSSQAWPIRGGKLLHQKSISRDLLLTGHEDGSVNFWDVSLDGAIRLLYKLNTACLFGFDTSLHLDGSGDSEDYGGWPPFRKVGVYDPFTDDPCLASQKIYFCLLSETLIVAGMAGQVVMFQYDHEERDPDIRIACVNIVSDQENFMWRGHNALEVKSCQSKLSAGFQPTCIVQMMPPVPCTVLAFQPEWQLLSAGTAYGICLFDYVRCKTVYTKCTITSSGAAGDGVTLSRRKSFQNMVRKSIRRLRGQTLESQRPSTAEHDQEKEMESKPSVHSDIAGQGDVRRSILRGSQRMDASAYTASDATPQASESSISRSSQAMTSGVRCLHFAQVFLLNTQASSASLWVGTNHGSIYVFLLTIPANDRRAQDAVQCIFAKEIRLRHGAPVVSIQALDHVGRPLPGPLEVQLGRAKAPDMSGSHYVVISSQQQLKVFTLPNLKTCRKFKFAAQRQGVQLSHLAFANFKSKKDEAYVETDAVSLTADGEMCVFTIPQLRPQLWQRVIAKENTSGINGCVFTLNGMGFFPCSPSELERFSLSARFPSSVVCSVELSDVSEASHRLIADASVSQEASDTHDVTGAPELSEGADESGSNLHVAGDRDQITDGPNVNNSANELLPESQPSPQQGAADSTLAEDRVVEASEAGAANVIRKSVAAAGSTGIASVTVDCDRAVSGPHGVDPVTCASFISIPLTTKVVKADIHDPPIKGNSIETIIDVELTKEVDKMSSLAGECLTDVR